MKGKFDLLYESIMSTLDTKKEYSEEDIKNMRKLLWDVYVPAEQLSGEEDTSLIIAPDKLDDEQVVKEYELRFGVHGEEYEECNGGFCKKQMNNKEIICDKDEE